ncbi:MAG: LptF/LptG family permease [Chthoniobacterales bacterium]
MKILDRYVGKNIIVTSIFGVVVLSLVLILGKIFKEVLDLLINHDVPLKYVLAFFVYALPFSLTFTIPWGFLTAMLLIFGRMSADNELIALKANGISIPRICIPVFALSIVLTLFCFWVNIEVAPRAEQAIESMVLKMVTSNPTAMFAADEVVDQLPDKRVYVGGKTGNLLKNIMLFELDQRSNVKKVLYANEGLLTADMENNQLLLELRNARFEERDENDPQNVNKIRQGIVVSGGTFPISLQSLYDQNTVNRRIISYTLTELRERLSKVDPVERLITEVEINKRFSASLACFAFALIAIPMGITTHRKETSVGFALSLAIAFTYFFFIILANTFCNKPELHPSLLMWTPNILFIGLGSIMFWRLSRR